MSPQISIRDNEKASLKRKRSIEQEEKRCPSPALSLKCNRTSRKTNAAQCLPESPHHHSPTALVTIMGTPPCSSTRPETTTTPPSSPSGPGVLVPGSSSSAPQPPRPLQMMRWKRKKSSRTVFVQFTTGVLANLIQTMGGKLLAEEAGSPELHRLVEGSMTNLSMSLTFPKPAGTTTSTISPTMPRIPQRFDKTPLKMNKKNEIQNCSTSVTRLEFHPSTTEANPKKQKI